MILCLNSCVTRLDYAGGWFGWLWVTVWLYVNATSEHTSCSLIFLDITCVYYLVMDFPSQRRTKLKQVRVNKDRAIGQGVRPGFLA